MTEEIIIAIIGAVGVVLAAIIGGVFSVLKKGENSNNTKIKQKQKGKNNTQIGVQNNNITIPTSSIPYGGDDKNE